MYIIYRLSTCAILHFVTNALIEIFKTVETCLEQSEGRDTYSHIRHESRLL